MYAAIQSNRFSAAGRVIGKGIFMVRFVAAQKLTPQMKKDVTTSGNVFLGLVLFSFQKCGGGCIFSI